MTFAPAFSFLTELGCGYVLLSCFSRLLNLLGMFLMLTFCIKFLRFAWHAKNHFRFFCDSGGIPRYRIILDYDTLPEPPKSKVAEIDPAKSPSITGLSPSKRGSRGNAYSEEASDTESLIVDEDDVFDVISLRRLVKMERRKANVAWSDLEKERTAAASSAEEAMAMILRLQNEKSSAEIESNQFRRMADERQGYEQELIEELQWTINQHEIQKNILEDQMGVYKEELKLYITEEELRELERQLEVEFGFDNDDVGPPHDIYEHEAEGDADDENSGNFNGDENSGDVDADENSDRGSVIIADDDDDGDYDGGSVVADDDDGGSVVAYDDDGGSVVAADDDHGSSVVAGNDDGGSVVADNDDGGSVVADDDHGGSVTADDDHGGSAAADDDHGGSAAADDDHGGSVIADDDDGGSAAADDDDDDGGSVTADDDHGGSVTADDDDGGSVGSGDDDPEPEDRSDHAVVSSPKTQSRELDYFIS
ncbi:hypothetical protein S245_009881 [Arachis hypogaea]